MLFGWKGSCLNLDEQRYRVRDRVIQHTVRFPLFVLSCNSMTFIKTVQVSRTTRLESEYSIFTPHRSSLSIAVTLSSKHLSYYTSRLVSALHFPVRISPYACVEADNTYNPQHNVPNHPRPPYLVNLRFLYFPLDYVPLQDKAFIESLATRHTCMLVVCDLDQFLGPSTTFSYRHSYLT